MSFMRSDTDLVTARPPIHTHCEMPNWRSWRRVGGKSWRGVSHWAWRASAAFGGTLQTMSGDRTLKLTAVVSRDGEWWVARCLEVEVTSQGHSVEEALEAVTEALELYFEDNPAPAGDVRPVVAPVEVSVPA